MFTAIKLPKRRACKSCKKTFKPTAFYEWWCGPECRDAVIRIAAEKGRQSVAKKKFEALKVERKMWRERKEKLTTTAEWKKRAQNEFNAYIRERDEGRPCISCGETNPLDLHGGKWDCGHFLSVGSHPEIRFDERNAFRQCKKCNGGAGHYAKKNHTVSQNYEANLIAEFGQEYVDWLRGPHEPQRYRREDFIRIRDEYKAKRKALIARREEAA